MANLTSINTFRLIHNLYKSIDATNPTDMRLDSVTKIHCMGEYFQGMKHLLIHIFLNIRNWILSPSSESIVYSSLEEYDEHLCVK